MKLFYEKAQPFINIGNRKYEDAFPAFYSNDLCKPITEILEKNTLLFLNEWKNYIEHKKKKKKFFLLYNETGWNTLMLYSYGLRYHKNCNHFKKTLAVIENIPNILTIYFSTLEPGTKLKPHFGDTDATYRIHLGLEIPASLPDCGIEVNGIQKEWKNGETIIFNDAHFHTAWNLSTQQRTVLIIDILKPEFAAQKWRIVPTILGAMGTGRILYPLKLINKLPNFFLQILHFFATLAFIIILPIQRILILFYKKN